MELGGGGPPQLQGFSLRWHRSLGISAAGACGSSQGLGEAVPLPVVAQPAPLHHQGLGCCQHQAFSTGALDQGQGCLAGRPPPAGPASALRIVLRGLSASKHLLCVGFELLTWAIWVSGAALALSRGSASWSYCRPGVGAPTRRFDSRQTGGSPAKGNPDAGGCSADGITFMS